MKLAERIAQIKELEAKIGECVLREPFSKAQAADAALVAAMRNAIGPLIHVVEQQREALEGLINFPPDFFDRRENEPVTVTVLGGHLKAARAALALMDKED